MHANVQEQCHYYDHGAYGLRVRFGTERFTGLKRSYQTWLATSGCKAWWRDHPRPIACRTCLQTFQQKHGTAGANPPNQHLPIGVQLPVTGPQLPVPLQTAKGAPPVPLVKPSSQSAMQLVPGRLVAPHEAKAPWSGLVGLPLQTANKGTHKQTNTKNTTQRCSKCTVRTQHVVNVTCLPTSRCSIAAAQLGPGFVQCNLAALTNQRAVARHGPPVACAIADCQGCSLSASCEAIVTCSLATCAWQTGCPT